MGDKATIEQPDYPLRIADNLALPREAVTQTFGILAIRGVGKTYTASVLIEEMLKEHLPVIVLDPLDVWWGLRSSADGKHNGLPIVVFGGDHGDVPLKVEDAHTIARLQVESNLSCVLSLRHLSKTKQRTFVAAFCEELYHLKGQGRYKQPVHVVFDEADAFAPQRSMNESARALGAVDDLVRRGRASGVGVTLISQRAAVLNKDVLTQIESLICLRTTSPHDQRALDEWIRANASEEHRATFMASLASLPIGEAWFWSPGWLREFVRIKVRRRETFDSSATPKMGEQAIDAPMIVSVDLDAIRTALAQTIEEAEGEDPKRLKQKIQELKAQLLTRPVERVEVRVEVPYEVEVPVSPITEADLTRLRVLSADLEEKYLDIKGIVEDLDLHITHLMGLLVRDGESERRYIGVDFAKDEPTVVQQFRMNGQPVNLTPKQIERLGKIHPVLLPTRTPAQYSFDEAHANFANGSQHVPNTTFVSGESEEAEGGKMLTNKLALGQRRMLEILYSFAGRQLTHVQLATLSGLAPSSGTFNTYLSSLKTQSLIIAVEKHKLYTISREGELIARSLGMQRTEYTRESLVKLWYDKMAAGERRMLDAVLASHPIAIQKSEIAEIAGLGAKSGTFNTYMSHLKSNGLVTLTVSKTGVLLGPAFSLIE